MAVKSSSLNAQELIKNINSKCKDEAIQTEIIGKCKQTCEQKYGDQKGDKCCVQNANGMNICNYDLCMEYEKATTMTYGCKSMLYVDYIVNASDTNYEDVFNNLYQLGDEINNVNAFLIHANVTEAEACHAGQVTMNAANLSRTLMREYGTKPSYLVLSIEDSCKDKFENEIAQSIFYNVYYLRMTGIMGIIYYDYLPDSSKILTDVTKPQVFLQLNNYYSNASYANSTSIKYNKEPLIFDSDGYNISKICDVYSKQSMMTADMNLVKQIKISRLNPNELETLNFKGETSWYYVYAIPMLDYGKWETVREISSSGAADAVTDYMNTKWSNFNCDVDSSLYEKGIHIDAERCGVSNYLLMAYKKNNIQFNCDDWYNMIDSFVLDNKVSVDKIQNLDVITMKQLAFAYAMQGEKKMLTQSEMRTYCYGSLYGNDDQIKDQKPCNAINDYVFIRGEYLEYIFTPDCYIPDIGKN